jgi:hypothetical protein
MRIGGVPLIAVAIAGCVDRPGTGIETTASLFVTGARCPDPDGARPIIERRESVVPPNDGLICRLAAIDTIDEASTSSSAGCCWPIQCNEALDPVSAALATDATCWPYACAELGPHAPLFDRNWVSARLAETMLSCSLTQEAAPADKTLSLCTYPTVADYDMCHETDHETDCSAGSGQQFLVAVAVVVLPLSRRRRRARRSSR